MRSLGGREEFEISGSWRAKIVALREGERKISGETCRRVATALKPACLRAFEAFRES